MWTGWLPTDHPLGTIMALADEALRDLSPEFRPDVYLGRAALKERLLTALFSVRSERCTVNERRLRPLVSSLSQNRRR